VCAHEFRQHGISAHVFEKEKDWGGLLRSATLNEVVYEPHGTHVVHTDDEEVWNLFNSYTPFNHYQHSVLTMVRGELLTWPIQRDEIERVYPRHVLKELEAKADFQQPGKYTYRDGSSTVADPETMNFEEWCLKIMPKEVYEDFVAPYTEKQWDRHPSKLAASFAPKRVQVRTDGDKRLFKDEYQGFPNAAQGGSYEEMLRGLLGNAQMHTTWKMTLDRVIGELERHPSAWRPDWIVVTAPLDDFCGNELGKMEWRGLTFSHKFISTEKVRECHQAATVVNYPSKDFPFIRTHETKHASGQAIKGTVVSTEFTGGPGRYYPVPRADGKNRQRNELYRELITEKIEALGPKVIITGRLATYRYQDTDEVARDALDAVREVMYAGLPAA
jgi:UDP-galactopyranose mutase